MQLPKLSAAKLCLAARLPWILDIASILDEPQAANLVKIAQDLDETVSFMKAAAFEECTFHHLQRRIVRATLEDLPPSLHRWYNTYGFPNMSLICRTDSLLPSGFQQVLLNIKQVCMGELVQGVPPTDQYCYELIRQIILRIIDVCIPWTSAISPPSKSLSEEDASLRPIDSNKVLLVRHIPWGPEGVQYQRVHRRPCNLKVKLAPLVAKLEGRDSIPLAS
ncbi:hypothetical protein FRC02_011570 [Tulasnella sp. 418]|nr:hypothetical protein FRC02_011570 [Tulasnella sp. 418]